LPPVEQNLVYRAVDLLRRRSGETRGLRVSLIKRIPSAAGMGGGSSDAAAALVGANLLWGLNWTRQQLEPLAAELGSDVPFFLSDSTAVCRGRGERVEPVAGGPPQHYVVVRPREGLSTATVYRQTQVAKCPERVDDLLGDLKAGRIGELSHRLFNRLQPAALQAAPCLEELQRKFTHVDVRGHQLSGSGSGYFGVCRHAKHARRVAGVLRARCRGRIFCVTSVGAVGGVRRRTSQN
jgi:4-diphosphocytidyl-2-C-methyl-D-erythritol kinase